MVMSNTTLRMFDYLGPDFTLPFGTRNTMLFVLAIILKHSSDRKVKDISIEALDRLKLNVAKDMKPGSEVHVSCYIAQLAFAWSTPEKPTTSKGQSRLLPPPPGRLLCLQREVR